MAKDSISKIHPKMGDGYKGVVQGYTNRSSCIFPILISEINDVNIVFLNYWRLKNNLNSVTCNIRIYSQRGDLECVFSKKVIASHNNISIKSILGNLKGVNEFLGVANVEFISEENLGFTFPGITAFYSSKDNYSAVHAAGRLKNPEESKYKGNLIETNWNCKWEKGITPFFSIFNGACNGVLGKINIKIKNPDQSIFLEESIDIKLANPFQNKIFFLDELLNYDINSMNSEAYVEVEIPYYDVFPRMICGNFYKAQRFLEVTHSFENQENNLDYLSPKKNDQSNLIPSINPIANVQDLDLKLIFFPTNCPGRAIGYWRSGAYNKSLDIHDESFDWICGGKDSKLKSITINNADLVKALDIVEGKIPTRINTNYIYRVHNSDVSYSTDIAAGHVTQLFPPKKRSWGHGIIGAGYNSILLMTSFSHDASTRYESKGKLTIYTDEEEFVSFHNIPKEGGLKIVLNEIIKDKIDISKPKIVSWFYDQEQRTKLMTYWLSYTSNGKITGDHAF